MKLKLSALCLLLALPASLARAQVTSENNDRLKEGLKRYPAADANKDGILTITEALAYLAIKKATSSSAPAAPKPGALTPDAANVAYGPHSRNKLDVYLAKNATGPTPLVVLIHGGGFRNGDKSRWSNDATVKKLLESGISCAAVNYPFLMDKPIQGILHDCARAVQFLRANSEKWNLDKGRFASMGGSAGAGTSLWLATRDDLADPHAEDPVLRESSRLSCAVCNATQATYDLSRWESFLGPMKPEMGSDIEAALFYHFPTVEAMRSESGKAILKECDMLSWITPADPPLLVSNSQVVEAPSNRGELLHCIHHAREVKKLCLAAAVSCIVVQDDKDVKTDAVSFLIEHLKPAVPKS